MIRLGFQNTKIFLLNVDLKNWSEKVFVVSKIRDIVPWAYVISDLNGEPITGSFYEREL